MEVLERLPFTAQKKIFDHLAKLADVRCLSSEEQEKYDESIKAVDDYYSGLYGSYVEGEEKGMAKGMAKGKAEVARNMMTMGMSLPQIMQATGLTEEELKQLQSQWMINQLSARRTLSESSFYGLNPVIKVIKVKVIKVIKVKVIKVIKVFQFNLIL